MANEDLTTTALLHRLFMTRSIVRFIKHFGEKEAPLPFHVYISNLCIEKKLIASQVTQKADIARTYGTQLFNGTRRPSRDKVLQLAFGFEMGYDEAQDLLKAAQKSPLYPRVKRDAVVMYALRNGYKLHEVQATLAEITLPVLGKGEKHE